MEDRYTESCIAHGKRSAFRRMSVASGSDSIDISHNDRSRANWNYRQQQICLEGIHHKGDHMKDVLFFNAMLTSKIITFVYWLLLLFVVVSGLSTIFGGEVTFVKFIFGLGIIIGGGLGARIWCEILVVLFKIHDNIKIIADKA